MLENHILTQHANQRSFGMMDINKRNKQHNLNVAYKTTAADEHGTRVLRRRARPAGSAPVRSHRPPAMLPPRSQMQFHPNVAQPSAVYH